MQKYGIPTFYFPTTVVFVDDNKDFLMNFSLQFDSQLSYKLYSSPLLALQHLEQQSDNCLTQQCFSQYPETIGCPATTQTINLDITAIYRKAYDAVRFQEVSIVVVDYSMPDIDGLELCKRIQDKPIKKVLLTGQADAQTAIDAFNQGIIDRFILKSDPNVIEKTNTAIHELQQLYFQEMSDFMVKVLALESPNFLQDTIFANFFYQLCKEKDVVEYYLTQNTGTFLLLSSEGNASWLIISTPQDLKMQIELANDMRVDEDVIKKTEEWRISFTFLAAG